MKMDYDKSEPNTPAILLSIFVSISVILLIVVWCVYFFKASNSQSQIKRESTQTAGFELQELRYWESQYLNQTKWVDKKKRKTKISISDAIKLTIKDYN